MISVAVIWRGQQQAAASWVQQLVEARDLLHHLSTADLGKLAGSVWPAMQVGEAYIWSLILMALIRQEMVRRERDG